MKGSIVNPYEVSGNQDLSHLKPPNSGWISLPSASIICLLTIATWRFYVWLGPNGIAWGLYVALLCCFLLSLTKHPSLRLFNSRRMTLVEFFTILAICMIFHGLLQPAVTSMPHKRVRTPPVASSPGSTANEPAAAQEPQELPLLPDRQTESTENP